MFENCQSAYDDVIKSFFKFSPQCTVSVSISVRSPCVCMYRVLNDAHFGTVAFKNETFPDVILGALPSLGLSWAS